MMLRKTLFAIVALAAASAALTSTVWAQATPSPSASPAPSTVIEGVRLTAADFQQLVTALHAAQKPNDKSIPIVVTFKPADEMPSYDKDWHYGGVQTAADGTRTMSVWVREDLKGDALRAALEPAFLLAIIDGGYAGVGFKQLYVVYAQRDAQLPANTPDPYLNRRKFATALVQAIAAASSNSSP